MKSLRLVGLAGFVLLVLSACQGSVNIGELPVTIDQEYNNVGVCTNPSGCVTPPPRCDWSVHIWDGTSCQWRNPAQQPPPGGGGVTPPVQTPPRVDREQSNARTATLDVTINRQTARVHVYRNREAPWRTFNGSRTLTNVPSGRYYVVVQEEGCLTQALNFAIEDGDRVRIQFDLVCPAVEPQPQPQPVPVDPDPQPVEPTPPPAPDPDPVPPVDPEPPSPPVPPVDPPEPPSPPVPPVDPVDPVDPVEPTDPVDPVDPVEPTDPDEEEPAPPGEENE